jgi:hypothetical protein
LRELTHSRVRISTVHQKEKKLNKTELIEALAHETEMSKAAAGRAIDALLEIITKSVAKKQDVQLALVLSKPASVLHVQVATHVLARH